MMSNLTMNKSDDDDSDGDDGDQSAYRLS
jgi:hypothetical protein